MFSTFFGSDVPDKDEKPKKKEKQENAKGGSGDSADPTLRAIEADMKKVVLELVADVAQLKDQVQALELAEPKERGFDQKKAMQDEIHSLHEKLMNRPGAMMASEEKEITRQLEAHEADLKRLKILTNDVKEKAASLERWMYMSKVSDKNAHHQPSVHMDQGQAVVNNDMEKDALRANMLKLEVQVRDVRESVATQVDAYLKKLRKRGLENGAAGVGPEISQPFGILPKEAVDTLREGIMEEVKLEQMKTLRSVQPLVKEALGGMKFMLPSSSKGGLSATAPIKVLLPGEVDDPAPQKR